MKRVRQRANAAMLFAAFIVVGMCLFLIRWSDGARDWALFRGNLGLYTDGILSRGVVTDRNGLVLARSKNGERSYAEDWAVRVACLHAVGDFSGNIGTGALTAMTDKLANYSLLGGAYDFTGTGSEVRLTIDAELQTTALRALGGRRGAVLLMDYTSGELLCMVSSPAYDPDSPPDLTRPEYEGAYINRGLSSVYTPGSVFKIVTLAAAIENIPDLDGRQFYCGGSVIIEGVAVTCTQAHGTQTVAGAFANSCNCAFAELSLELGAETIAAYAEDYGLCSGHELSGIETAAGSFQPAEEGSAELAWSGIGQSRDLVSPFALLRLTAAIANSGTLRTPTLLKSDWGMFSRLSRGSERIMRASTAEKFRELMRNNVETAYGDYRFPGLELCGKTGTAEVEGGASNAWFVGFLQDRAHPLCVVVIAERSGGGLAVAGAIANEVLQAAVK